MNTENLTPNFESIIVARKPCEGSCIDNILTYGVGAINVAECRIPFLNDNDYKITADKNQHEKFGTAPLTDNIIYGDYSMIQPKNYESDGRFPSNVILTYDDSDFDEVCGGMPYTKSTGGSGELSVIHNFKNTYAGGWKPTKDADHLGGVGDEGSAARYFYNAQVTERDQEQIVCEVQEMENQEEQQSIRLYSEGNSYKLYQGSMLDMLDVIEPNSIDAIVTDPPYELGFMGKGWDKSGISFQKETWEKCFQVLKPGGYLLAFAGSRTSHRITCAIEDAGFEIRDTIMWLYGCLSEDTEVLTENGFKLFKDISHDESIKIYDLDKRSFGYEVPEKWSSYIVENEICYSIKSEFTDQIVSKNHRCIVMEHGKYVVKFAENLDRTEIVPHIENDDNLNVCIATVTPIVYSGIIFCPTVSTGCFVARRNGKVFITGNSGFPKGMNIGKGIEAKLTSGSANTQEFKNLNGEKVSSGNWGIDNMQYTQGNRSSDYSADEHLRTDKVDYTTEEGKKWDGWNTSLKPSYEPITVARKPLDGGCIENILKYGVGAINIDECRIGTDTRTYKGMSSHKPEGAGTFRDDDWEPKDIEVTVNGRYPANVILTYDETDKEEVIGGMPDTTSNGGRPSFPDFNDAGKKNVANGGMNKIGYNVGDTAERVELNYTAPMDSGSAARYYYCAKASTRDRDEGLDDFEVKPAGELQGGRQEGSAGSLRVRNDGSIGVNPFAGNGQPKRNVHPSVKPTSLMGYLVRLVTPKGGTVLDPFNGSGSTGKAAMYENNDRNADYKYIGIELSGEYLAISDARINYAIKAKDIVPEKPMSEEKKKVIKNQMSLFDLPQ